MQWRFEATLAGRGVGEIRLNQCLQELVAVALRFSMSCYGGFLVCYLVETRAFNRANQTGCSCSA